MPPSQQLCNPADNTQARASGKHDQHLLGEFKHLGYFRKDRISKSEEFAIAFRAVKYFYHMVYWLASETCARISVGLNLQGKSVLHHLSGSTQFP
jgi:hypothetical protein